MKTKYFCFKLKAVILVAIVLFLTAGFINESKAGDSSWTKTADYGSSGESKAVVYSYTWYFRSDSLENHFTRGNIPFLPYSQKPITLTITSGGTTKNFTVRMYGTNIVVSGAVDTTKLNLIRGWDTTGIYTNKPVNKDSINTDSLAKTITAGATFGQLTFAIDGGTGNREDVWVRLDVAMLKED